MICVGLCKLERKREKTTSTTTTTKNMQSNNGEVQRCRPTPQVHYRGMGILRLRLGQCSTKERKQQQQHTPPPKKKKKERKTKKKENVGTILR